MSHQWWACASIPARGLTVTPRLPLIINALIGEWKEICRHTAGLACRCFTFRTPYIREEAIWGRALRSHSPALIFFLAPKPSTAQALRRSLPPSLLPRAPQCSTAARTSWAGRKVSLLGEPIQLGAHDGGGLPFALGQGGDLGLLWLRHGGLAGVHYLVGLLQTALSGHGSCGGRALRCAREKAWWQGAAERLSTRGLGREEEDECEGMRA